MSMCNTGTGTGIATYVYVLLEAIAVKTQVGDTSSRLVLVCNQSSKHTMSS